MDSPFCSSHHLRITATTSIDCIDLTVALSAEARRPRQGPSNLERQGRVERRSSQQVFVPYEYHGDQGRGACLQAVHVPGWLKVGPRSMG